MFGVRRDASQSPAGAQRPCSSGFIPDPGGHPTHGSRLLLSASWPQESLTFSGLGSWALFPSQHILHRPSVPSHLAAPLPATKVGSAFMLH